MKSPLRNLIFLSIPIFFSSTPSFADTTTTRIVAPGVVHTEYLLPGPFTLDVLEVELKNPLIQLESYRPNGLSRTSVQSAANDREGHRVIGAVNADFFSFETGWPVNNQVVDGKPAQGVTSVRSHLAVAETKKPYIEQFSFDGRLVEKNGSAIALRGVNTTRGAATTVLFTSFKGGSTGTDASGIECSLTLVSPNWLTNDTLLFVVGSKQTAGNMAIPSSGAVLSAGSGTSATFVTNNIFVNDTVKVYVGFNPSNVKKIVQLIGGAGRILKNGVNVSANSVSSEGIGTDFVTARHPRTCAGFNADTSKFYLCTVDGRQASSMGMSFNEMASFLSSIKLSDAFNLDGGGSTTMVVRGVVVNSPSDPGGERSVANSLQVISTAPTGTLSLLNITEDRVDVFQGNTFQFHAEGKDQYFNPLPVPAGVVWNADAAIGTIDNNGLFSAKSVNDSGWVRIQYNAASDSARVYVRVVKEVRVYPQTLIMVPGERLTLSVRGTDSGNNKVTLQNNQVIYLNNASGLNVDAEGIVSSTGFGKGTLTVKLDTVTRTLYYNATGADTAVLVEDFHDTFNWKWDVLNTDPDNITFGLSVDSIAPDPAFKISYNFPPPSATVLLNTNLPLSSRVDSIFLRVYGDGGGHSLKLFFNDKEGQAFSIVCPTIVNWNNEWRTVGFKLVNAVPVSSGTIDFPLTLTQIQITIGVVNQVSGKATGSIYLDELKAHYPNRAVAPTVLFDFNTDVSGWLQPSQGNVAQLIGINIAASNLQFSTEHPYEGAGCGKWTFVDDPAGSLDWSVRIARGTTSELGSMLRGSYIGAWVWANGQTNLTLRTVIRDGNGQICQGPSFPVNHNGWKLIGTKLDDALFTPYLTAGKITDVNNRFNGFKVEGPNSVLNGQTRIFFVDKMVTSALTVPTGFIDFGAAWDPIGGKVDLHWGVNSEISVDRYVIERSSDGVNFADIGFVNAVGNIDTAKNYTYEDVTAGKGVTYSYRIRQITNDGAQELTSKITVVTTGVKENPARISYTYDLGQNFPNPFNPATHVRFSISNLGFVTLKIYNIIGKEVATLIKEEMKPGSYTIRWDASEFPSGIYFSRLLAGTFSATRKLVLLK
jgi:hypothetical protein